MRLPSAGNLYAMAHKAVLVPTICVDFFNDGPRSVTLRPNGLRVRSLLLYRRHRPNSSNRLDWQLDWKMRKVQPIKSLLFDGRDMTSRKYDTSYQECLQDLLELSIHDLRCADSSRALSTV
ncbi:hypothetical protein BDV97DRAFT_129771 [Delphinella strobiligena]|nr:hypothetical protein BDV97DRAFT_129771 [Delphinella strobiligena]